MLSLYFSDRPVRDFTAARAADATRFAAFFHAMLRSGVYLPPAPLEAWFTSSAHTPDVVDETVRSAERALREL
jgi:glutamate-1-semialdehyde 2,1-aminomutase